MRLAQGIIQVCGLKDETKVVFVDLIVSEVKPFKVYFFEVELVREASAVSTHAVLSQAMPVGTIVL